jgi:hypothetical protein
MTDNPRADMEVGTPYRLMPEEGSRLIVYASFLSVGEPFNPKMMEEVMVTGAWKIRDLDREVVAQAARAEAAEAERDEAQTDLSRVIMTLPTGKGERAAGAVEGVKMMRMRLQTELAALRASMAQVRADERERCATVKYPTQWAPDNLSQKEKAVWCQGGINASQVIQSAIRAMGDPS